MFADRRATLRSALLAALLLAAPVPPLGAQAPAELWLWIPPTEGELFRDGKAIPTIEDQRRFFDDVHGFFADEYGETLSPRLRVVDVREKTLHNHELARQVLGQRVIFRQLSRFLDEQRYSGRITVRFLDWEELLGVLENLPVADRRQSPHVTAAPSSWIPHLADRGILAPLDGLDPRGLLPRVDAVCSTRRIMRWRSGNRVLARVGRAFAAEPGWETRFALPWLVDLRFLFYWKDRFGDVRFENRERFAAVLDSVARAQPADSVYVPPFAVPSAPDWDLLHISSLLWWGAGGEFMTFADFLPAGAARDGLAYLHRLRRQGSAAFPRVRRNELEQQFLDGRVGSLVSGFWMVRQLRDALGDTWYTRVGVDLPPFNAPGQPKTTFVGGLHLGLTPAGAAHPAARALIEYLALEAPRRDAGESLTVPGTQAGLDSLLAALPSASGLRSLLPLALQSARHFPRVPEWAVVVEREAIPIELFQLFKHVGEGNELASETDLRALQARVDREIYNPPRWSLFGGLVAVIILGLGVLLLRHWHRQAIEELEALTEKQRELASTQADLAELRTTLHHQRTARDREESASTLERLQSAVDDFSKAAAEERKSLLERLERLGKKEPPVILMLSSEPANGEPLRLHTEQREIKEELRPAGLRWRFNFQTSVRPKDFSRELLELRPRIVHFSGHGENGLVLLEDDSGWSHPVGPGGLVALMKLVSGHVECVVLNACHTEKTAREISESIAYAIGMRGTIEDDAAIAFSVGFYQALGRGRAIEESFNWGCAQIGMRCGEEFASTPVLEKKEGSPSIDLMAGK